VSSALASAVGHVGGRAPVLADEIDAAIAIDVVGPRAAPAPDGGCAPKGVCRMH